MARSIWQKQITDEQGNLQTDVQVTIRNQSDNELSTIYAGQSGGAQLSNPFNTGASSFAKFFAEPGFYKVSVFKNGDTAEFQWNNVGDNRLREDIAEPDSNVVIGGVGIKKRAIQVATVAEAKSLNAPVDTIIETQGYYESGDGGANRYVVEPLNGSSDDRGSVIYMDDKVNQLRGLFPDGVSAKQFGANGVEDDTSAVQAAHNYGKTLEETDSDTFLISSLVAKVSVKGGTYKRIANSSGSFIVTANPDVTLDCNVDCSNTSAGAFGFEIRHESCGTGPNFHLFDCLGNGVDARDADDITILGKVDNCTQSHVFVIAQNQDMRRLKIDVKINGVAVGTSNNNGGVKVHGTASYAVVNPIINADVFLFESASMPKNAVCIETLNNVVAPRIAGFANGGSIGCTMNGSPNGAALVIAKGQHSIGLEITNGSHGAKFLHGSSSIDGDTVSCDNSCQGDSSNDIEFYAYTKNPTDIRDAVSANFYLTNCLRPKIFGYAERIGGAHYIRLRDVKGIKGKVTCNGSGVNRAITLATATDGTDDVTFYDSLFVGISSFINLNGTSSKGRFRNVTIENSGNFISGSATLNNYQFTPDCTATNFQVGQGDLFHFLDYKQALAPSLLEAWGSGSPEGVTRAAVGSVYHRTDGGAGTSYYVKESGASTTGWVAK